MTTETLTFRDHLAREWQYVPRRAPAIMALVGVACVLFNHLVLPLFPERALEFMRRGFRLDDLAGVLVLNDLMGVYFPTFFLGLLGSLGVVLTAREEHRLEVLLAKPVPAGAFVAARTLPVLAATAAVGAAISVACAIAVALHRGIGTSVGPAGTLGGGLALTALAVVLLAALQIVFARLRDPFTGMLVACAAWLATSIPTAVLLYRPDAYDGREALLHGVAMPSLLWHEATMAWLGPLLLVAAAPITALLARAAGRVLERSDAM
jgi:ABC-type transport system involved in multi-copper enzyme maturation permease subunit